MWMAAEVCVFPWGPWARTSDKAKSETIGDRQCRSFVAHHMLGADDAITRRHGISQAGNGGSEPLNEARKVKAPHQQHYEGHRPKRIGQQCILRPRSGSFDLMYHRGTPSLDQLPLCSHFHSSK